MLGNVASFCKLASRRPKSGNATFTAWRTFTKLSAVRILSSDILCNNFSIVSLGVPLSQQFRITCGGKQSTRHQLLAILVYLSHHWRGQQAGITRCPVSRSSLCWSLVLFLSKSLPYSASKKPQNILRTNSSMKINLSQWQTVYISLPPTVCILWKYSYTGPTWQSK